jgi:predicted acyltransferase
MSRERLVSVDAFRGATVTAMILVNNPGDWGNIYDPLEHAAWHGWTPTDLIFPFFLFLVGASLAFSSRDTTTAAAIRAKNILGLGYFMEF